MLLKPPECIGCKLEHLGEGFCPPFGTGSNGVALVGMAPAWNEIVQGVPFVGRAGAVLSKILRKVGDREEFAIWNTIQCKGPNDALTFSEAKEAIDYCGVHRRQYMERYAPKIRVAMGAVPFHNLCQSTTPITKARGYRYETPEGPVIPTYHPSFLGRGK